MQAISFFYSSTTLPRRPEALFSPLPPPRGKKPYILAMAASSNRGSSSSNSNYKGRHFGGRLVDENMIVLRMRIRETKLSEASDEQLPAHWMEWEQKYYPDYIQDVLEAVGLLQNYLMHLRPSSALGIIALVTLAVLISSGVALVQAVHIAQMIISTFHSGWFSLLLICISSKFWGKKEKKN